MTKDYFGVKLNAGRMRSMVKITSTLLELMREKSFSQISVTELCKKAGTTRKTFYKNFDSKTGVIERALDGMFLEMTHRYDFNEVDPRVVMQFAFEYFMANRDLAAVFSDKDLFDPITDKIIEYVEIVYDDTLYKATSFEPAMSEYYHKFMAGGIISIVRSWVAADFKQPPKTMALLSARLLSGVIK